MTMALIECNDIKCKHQWEKEIDPDLVIGNRLSGLIFCPKCGRFDSHYIITIEL